MKLYDTEVPHYRLAAAWATVVRDTDGKVNLETHTVEGETTESLTLSDGTELSKLPSTPREFDFFGISVTLLYKDGEPDIVSAIRAKDSKLTASWLMSLGRAYCLANKVICDEKYGSGGKKYGWLRMIATSLSVHLYNSTSASFRMSDSRRLIAVETFLKDDAVNATANHRATFNCFTARLVELSTTSCMIFREGQAIGQDAVKILVDVLKNKSSEKDANQKRSNQGLRESLDMLGVQTGW